MRKVTISRKVIVPPVRVRVQVKRTLTVRRTISRR
jgi:hypothetical protein